MRHRRGRSAAVTLRAEPVVRLKSAMAPWEQLAGKSPPVLRLASIGSRHIDDRFLKPKFRFPDDHSTNRPRHAENHEEHGRTHRCRRPETSLTDLRFLPNFSCYRAAH